MAGFEVTIEEIISSERFCHFIAAFSLSNDRLKIWHGWKVQSMHKSNIPPCEVTKEPRADLTLSDPLAFWLDDVLHIIRWNHTHFPGLALLAVSWCLRLHRNSDRIGTGVLFGDELEHSMRTPDSNDAVKCNLTCA
jgi:hypothetical protein